ncbi:MAG TPA: PilT/PilU family type 4a pilus ATPase [Myxococcota bacterium]|nr:PilT/PilU family type 4a pilus ATPase [Myxococcota bacterium]
MSQASLLNLLSRMEKYKASDLFISEDKIPALRIDGSVRRLKMEPTTTEEIEELLNLALTDHGRLRLDEEGDLDCGLSLEDGRRFRLNLARHQGRISIVARAVLSGDLTFEELGLPEPVRALSEHHRGLVLVTGATGSGKSTTIAALIAHINRTRKGHIVTIEDPIEFVHKEQQCRVTQREVGQDTADFHSALRTVVRQSPDVILIGEMRDAETVQVATQAALTGHLVFASLHTIDATQTLQRIMSFFPDHLKDQVAMDLSMSLKGIVSQRLVPRCSGKGRVLAIELLSVTAAVSKLLREQRVDEMYDHMRGAKDPTMIPFNRSLLALFKAEVIDYATGIAYSTNADEFSLQAEGMATSIDTFKGHAGAVGEMDMKSLLHQVLDRDASDLHLTVGRPPILRISGRLVPIGERKLTDADMRMLLFSILSGRQRSVYELERELDFALALDNGRRFRVNAYYQRGRMATSLRAIPRHIPDADELGIPDAVLRLGSRSDGLLLVVGPTGAGKSTTLACLIDRINHTRACRIITIEDPIEYAHKSKRATIDQREVFADTKSFAAALKYILRQDPDVILVGEMRDRETISAALTAAETGHLVLATLHANDSLQAIDRIIDVFPAHQQAQIRSMCSSCLLGVVSQRLLPLKDSPGRVASFEVLLGTSAIRNLIRDGKMHQASSIMEGARGEGMVTMDRALKDLYTDGVISYEAALPYMRNPKVLDPPQQDRLADPGPEASGGGDEYGGWGRRK